MRKTLTTAALLLAFSCPAFAGEMGTPGSPAPPPATANAVQEPTDGEITTGAAASLTQIALDLLAALPSLH
jgi:ABC-type molybdate transport system substrate-binding protein